MVNKIPIESAKLFYHRTSNKSLTGLIHSKNIAPHTHIHTHTHTHTISRFYFTLCITSPESKLEILSVSTFPFTACRLKLKTILSSDLGTQLKHKRSPLQEQE